MGNIPSKTSRRPGPSAAAAGALLLHVHRLLLLIAVSALLSVWRLLSVSLLLLRRGGIVASSSLWRALWWLVRLLGILWPSVEIFVRHVCAPGKQLLQQQKRQAVEGLVLWTMADGWMVAFEWSEVAVLDSNICFDHGESIR